MDDVKEGARKSYPSVLSYPIVQVRLQSTADGGQQDTTIALILNDVSCFTANVTLCSNTSRPQKQVDEIVRALAKPDAKSACASATGSTGWSVAHGTALYQSLLACEKFEMEVDTVSYSVRCDVRIHCFTSTGATSYKPCCQFYEYLIDSGISRAIIGTAISKCGGVRAGLELRVFSSDKTLLGVQGPISFVFSDTNSGHKSLCNASAMIALGTFGGPVHVIDLNNMCLGQSLLMHYIMTCVRCWHQRTQMTLNLAHPVVSYHWRTLLVQDLLSPHHTWRLQYQ
jgi:hypothetical protein